MQDRPAYTSCSSIIEQVCEEYKYVLFWRKGFRLHVRAFADEADLIAVRVCGQNGGRLVTMRRG